MNSQATNDKTLQWWSQRLFLFIRLVSNRFHSERCWRMAAGLSYTSLLAVVPLSAIAFSMLTAFPVFEGVHERLQNAVFTNFLPSSAVALSGYLDQFITNTTSLSAIGIIALGATAILLLGTIESDFNAIFRVRRPRPLIPRLLVFWGMITLGPLLLGASFSLTTYLYIATEWMGLDLDSGLFGIAGRLIPTALIIFSLTFFFMVIPNKQINFRSAIVGGTISGILFVLLRSVFGWYVITFPTYQNVYGTLSVVPIFLIWMYLSWSVVLLGGVITTATSDFRRRELRILQGNLHRNDRILATMTLLDTLYNASKAGKLYTEAQLLDNSNYERELCESELEAIIDSGLVCLDTDGKCIISRDLSHVSLHDLYTILKMDLPETVTLVANSEAAPWQVNTIHFMKKARISSEHALSISLSEILDGSETIQSDH